MGVQLTLPGVDDGPSSPPEAPAPRELSARSSLKAALAAFEFHMREQGFSEHTCKAFASDLRLLIQYLGAGKAVGIISTGDLNRFVRWLQHERRVPCNAKSLARRVTALKVFFGWLADVQVLGQDPADPVIHRPVVTPAPAIISESEIGRVLDVTEELRRGAKSDARPHLLVGLLLHTGAKKGECMSIVLNHFDFSDPARPVLWIRYANPRRRHKERKLNLPVWWPAVLAEYRVQYQIRDALFPCTARNLEYVLDAVGGQAGITQGLSFEMLRWLCAVRDHRAGLTGDKLRQKLGVSKTTWREVGPKVEQLARQSR